MTKLDQHLAIWHIVQVGQLYIQFTGDQIMPNKKNKQAGAEPGQAQLKLGLDFNEI